MRLPLSDFQLRLVLTFLSLPPGLCIGGAALDFLIYAQSYYQSGKKSAKKAKTMDALLGHTKKLSQSLHLFETKELQKAALDLFERIQQYTGEAKRTEKVVVSPDHQLQALVDFLLKCPDLGDEAYCLIFKQMTNNPSAYVFLFQMALY